MAPFEHRWNVVGHGDVEPAFYIVPVEGDVAVKGASPVDGAFVVFGEGVIKMLGMLLANIFDTEVILSLIHI